MTSPRAIAAAAVLALAPVAAGLWHDTARAGPILYEQTYLTGAVVNADGSFPFTNCLAAEGCLGKPGLVDVGGADPLAPVVFDFTLSPAEIAAVTGAPGIGTLTLVAARDIGHRVGLPADDFLVTTVDGAGIGNLFQDTIDTCPPGERGIDYLQTIVCGPNFHTDVTASDSLIISSVLFQAIAADGTIQAVLTPSPAVGRLKIFSATLRYMESLSVPEPATSALLALALAGIGFARNRRGPTWRGQ